MKLRFDLTLLALLAVVVAVSAVPTLYVTHIKPDVGITIGATIQLYGAGFSKNAEVTFCDTPSGPCVPADTDVSSKYQLSVVVPVGAVSGDVFVLAGNKVSNPIPIVIE